MLQRYNFGAGPAMLPEAILREAQSEWLNWHNTGMSIVEIGHRTKDFMDLLLEAEADLRALLAIPEDYAVLFLGGAARTQFAMIPMNFIEKGQEAAYVVSGIWSKMALEEGLKISHAYTLASAEAINYRHAPSIDNVSLKENTAYVYYTPNETINGIRMAPLPDLGVPIIADMTSCLLSEPLNIRDYGLIFAGAQKNIGPSGLTVVIVRKDLLARTPENIVPTMLDYRTHVQHHSLYATPPTFNCYLAQKMFKWLLKNGGVESFFACNLAKSRRLYDYIDNSKLYICPIEKPARSLMNVCFSLNKPELESIFLEQANNQGLYALKGHRLVGGLRASLYNAMPMAGVDALIEFMNKFEKQAMQ